MIILLKRNSFVWELASRRIDIIPAATQSIVAFKNGMFLRRRISENKPRTVPWKSFGKPSTRKRRTRFIWILAFGSRISKARECLLFPVNKVDCTWYVTFFWIWKNDKFIIKKLNEKNKSVSLESSRKSKCRKRDKL